MNNVVEFLGMLALVAGIPFSVFVLLPLALAALVGGLAGVG